MKTDLNKALEFDALAEAERITGKSYKESNETSSLGMLLMAKNNNRKTALLQANNDTCNQNNLEQNISVIEDMGFDLIYCEDIPNTKDKFRIFWGAGVLLVCDSYYDDTTINSGHAYFNYRGDRNGMPSCSNGHAGDIEGTPVWEGHIDIREGLRNSLETMKESGMILEKWIKQPFLWLLHYNDTKDKDYDYNSINAKRILLLPKDIQEAIKAKEAIK